MRWFLALILPFTLFATDIPSVRFQSAPLKPQNILDFDIEWIFWNSFALKAGPEEATVYLPSIPSLFAKDSHLIFVSTHEDVTYTFEYPSLYTPGVAADSYFHEALETYDTYPLQILHSSFSVKEGQDILDLTIHNQENGIRTDLRFIVTPHHHYILSTTRSPEKPHKHEKFIRYFAIKEFLE